MPDERDTPGGQTPKFKLEDIINVGEIQQQLASVFAQTFEQIEKHGTGAFKAVEKQAGISFKNIERVRTTFDKKRMSAERFKFESLKAENKKLLGDMETIHKKEVQMVIDGAKTKTAATRRRRELEKKFAREKAEFEKKQDRDVAAARKAMVAAEGGIRGAMTRDINRLITGTEKWKKSLMDTKTWWEAIMVTLVAAAGQVSDIAKTQAAVRRAGFAGTTGGFGLVGPLGAGQGDVGKLQERALGGIEDELILPAGERAQILSTLASAPKLLAEVDQKGGTALKSFVGKMGDVGVTIDKSTALAAEASQRYNFTLEETNRLYDRARAIADNTNLEFSDVFENMMRMTGVLRQVSTSGDLAGQVLTFARQTLDDIAFSNVEVGEFSENLAKALGDLKPSKLTGLLAFRDSQFPSRDDVVEAMENPVGVLISTLSKQAAQFQQGSLERLLGVEQLAQQQIPGLSGRGIVALEEMLDSLTGLSTEEIAQKIDELKTKFPTPDESLKNLEKEGFQTLRDMRGPLKTLEDTFTTFSQALSSVFIPVMTELGRFLQGPFIKRLAAKPTPTPVKVELTLDDLNRPSLIEQTLSNIPVDNRASKKSGLPQNPNATRMTK